MPSANRSMSRSPFSITERGIDGLCEEDLREAPVEDRVRRNEQLVPLRVVEHQTLDRRRVIPGERDRAELDSAGGEDAIGGGRELPLRKRQGENPRQRRDTPARRRRTTRSAPARQRRRARLRLVGFIALLILSPSRDTVYAVAVLSPGVVPRSTSLSLPID